MDQAGAEQTILVVDDEASVRRYVRSALETDRWQVIEAVDAAQAMTILQETPVRCVLLDVMLPDLDGFSVLRHIRDLSDVPVILLTGRGHEDDRVRGLDLGADDYVVKPFGVRELLARVRAASRRGAAQTDVPPDLEIGGLRLDFAMRRAFLGGALLDLTPTEFALLAELARRQGQVVLPRELLRTVWGNAYADDVGLLRTAIWRLRRKVEPDPAAPQYIVTVPRVGYTFGPSDN